MKRTTALTVSALLVLLLSTCNVQVPPLITDNTSEAYSSVNLLTPVDGITLTPGQELIFQWEHLATGLPDTVIYQLVLVERLPGQSFVEALSENERIVNARIPNGWEYFDPDLSLPASGNEFVWSVSALNANGKPLDPDRIWAKPHRLRLSGCYESQIIDVYCIGMEGGDLIYRVTVRVTNFGDNVGVYEERTNIIPPFIRPVGAGIISAISKNNGDPTASPGNFDDIDFDLTINGSATSANIELHVWQYELDGDICQEVLFETFELPPCCFDCRTRKFGITATPTVTSANTIVLAGTFVGGGTGNIKSVKAKLNWFRFLNSDELCETCLASSAQGGNFIPPSDITDIRFDPGQMASSHVPPQARAINWESASAGGADISTPVPFSLTISVPDVNPLSCCTDAIEFCIQYQFTEMDCLVCKTDVCYQLSR